MNRVTVLMIRALIVVLIAAVIGFQGVLVMASLGTASPEIPDGMDLVIWGCMFGFALCVEVVLVCVWRLVTLARAERIFNAASFAWVNTALIAVLAATAFTVAASVTVAVAGVGVPPGIPLAGLVLALFGLGLALVILVMCALLRQATALERELAVVV